MVLLLPLVTSHLSYNEIYPYFSAFIVFAIVILLWKTLNDIVNDEEGSWEPDEWVRASLVLFTQIGELFMYLIECIKCIRAAKDLAD